MGTRMAATISALPMSRPATRSAYSGSSSDVLLNDSFDGMLTAVAVARRSQGQAENLIRVLEATLNGPEERLPASDC